MQNLKRRNFLQLSGLSLLPLALPLSADFELKYLLPKMRTSIGIKCNNLTNQKNYYGIGSNNSLAHNRFIMPLISRNILVSVRHEF